MKSVVQDQLGTMQPRLMMSTSALKQAQDSRTAVQMRVRTCMCVLQDGGKSKNCVAQPVWPADSHHSHNVCLRYVDD